MVPTLPWGLAPIEAVLHLMDAARPAPTAAVPPCPPRILAAVRHAIHRWHSHDGRPVLPPDLQAQLEARRGSLACPQCGAQI
jgi:hypothetical protein